MKPPTIRTALNEKRWPDHFCHGRLLWISTIEGASSSLVAPTTSELTQWVTQWPLPIGRRAVELRLGTLNRVVINLVPFEEWEEALWARRIYAADCTLNLFGLGTPYEQGAETNQNGRVDVLLPACNV